MIEVSFYCTPEQAKDKSYIEQAVFSKLKRKDLPVLQFKWFKRSIDARKNNIRFLCTFHVFKENEVIPKNYQPEFQKKIPGQEVHIIGLGPAGIFAALKTRLSQAQQRKHCKP